jgi:hypothetical protein
LVLVDGHAGSDADRADLHVTKKNVPAFLASIGAAAAGKIGHALLKRRLKPEANGPRCWAPPSEISRALVLYP